MFGKLISLPLPQVLKQIIIKNLAKMKTTIEHLAERMHEKVWVKGDLKRIYLNDAGYNTKKMTTKAYIYQSENGDFKVLVNIDCPSQHSNWIDAQEEELKEEILNKIERCLFEINNPCADFDDFKSQEIIQEKKKEESVKITERNENQKEIENLSIENIGDFLFKKGYWITMNDKYLWDIKNHHYHLETQSKFLNVEDKYPAIIYDNYLERIFLTKDKNATEKWEEPLGKIRVGQSYIEFDDVVEFSFVRKQGGKNKRNVFRPTSIPESVTKKLNQVLEEEQAKRKEHLRDLVEKHRKGLIESIDIYKNKMLN